MKKTKKSDKIAIFIADGEFDTEDIGCVKQLIDDAGAKLDSAYAANITGCPIFKTADGKWYTGSVAFTVYPANLKAVAESLCDGDFCECQNCGRIEHEDALVRVHDYEERVAAGEEAPHGECSLCGCLSHKITKARARVLAGLVKSKRVRRTGLK